MAACENPMCAVSPVCTMMDSAAGHIPGTSRRHGMGPEFRSQWRVRTVAPGHRGA